MDSVASVNIAYAPMSCRTELSPNHSVYDSRLSLAIVRLNAHSRVFVAPPGVVADTLPSRMPLSRNGSIRVSMGPSVISKVAPVRVMTVRNASASTPRDSAGRLSDFVGVTEPPR